MCGRGDMYNGAVVQGVFFRDFYSNQRFLHFAYFCVLYEVCM